MMFQALNQLHHQPLWHRTTPVASGLCLKALVAWTQREVYKKITSTLTMYIVDIYIVDMQLILGVQWMVLASSFGLWQENSDCEVIFGRNCKRIHAQVIWIHIKGSSQTNCRHPKFDIAQFKIRNLTKLRSLSNCRVHQVAVIQEPLKLHLPQLGPANQWRRTVVEVFLSQTTWKML